MPLRGGSAAAGMGVLVPHCSRSNAAKTLLPGYGKQWLLHQKVAGGFQTWMPQRRQLVSVLHFPDAASDCHSTVKQSAALSQLLLGTVANMVNDRLY